MPPTWNDGMLASGTESSRRPSFHCSLRGVGSTLRPVSLTGLRAGSGAGGHDTVSCALKNFSTSKRDPPQADLAMPWLHEGVVIRGTYINIHGKKVKIDPNAPEAHKKPWSKHGSYAFLTIIFTPWNLFFCFTGAMIPTFHHSMWAAQNQCR